MITAQQLYDLAKHALGKTPAAGHDLWASINQAGRALYTERDWSWSQQTETTLAATAGSEYISLPADFASVDSISLYLGGITADLTRSTIDQIRRLYDGVLPTVATLAGRWLWDIVNNPQASTTAQPTKKLILYPLPPSNGVPTIRLVYKRTWIDLSPACGYSNASVSSITRTGTTATVTQNAHGYTVGQVVRVSGVTGPTPMDAALYNGLQTVANPAANTFDYVMTGTPSGSAVATSSTIRTELASLPNLPDEWEAALKYRVRMEALRTENQQFAAEEQMYEAEITRLEKYDAQRRIAWHRIRGAVRIPSDRPLVEFGQSLPVSSVTFPP